MTAFWIATGVLVVSIVAAAIAARVLAHEAEQRRWVDEAHEPGVTDSSA